MSASEIVEKTLAAVIDWRDSNRRKARKAVYNRPFKSYLMAYNPNIKQLYVGDYRLNVVIVQECLN